MNAWLRHWRYVRRLRREEHRARDRFFRAYYAYQDVAVVFRHAPGAWAVVGQAQDEATARMKELQQVQGDLRRAQQVGRAA